MADSVLIQHAESKYYLSGGPRFSVLLGVSPFPWGMNATPDEVANYTFKSPILYDGCYLGSKSGSLNNPNPIIISPMLVGFVFYRLPGASVDPNKGCPIQVWQGGETMMLNVSGDTPIFGGDDNCRWIVTSY